jgi:hypothetical protein
MTVRQLLKLFNKVNPDLQVILSGDEEGNDFGLLSEIEYDNKNLILIPGGQSISPNEIFDLA